MRNISPRGVPVPSRDEASSWERVDSSSFEAGAIALDKRCTALDARCTALGSRCTAPDKRCTARSVRDARWQRNVVPASSFSDVVTSPAGTRSTVAHPSRQLEENGAENSYDYRNDQSNRITYTIYTRHLWPILNHSCNCLLWTICFNLEWKIRHLLLRRELRLDVLLTRRDTHS